MKHSEHIEARWLEIMNSLAFRLKIAKWLFVPLYFLMLVASFMGWISGWWIGALALITLLVLIYILKSGLKCPQCEAPLLTWKQFGQKDAHQCYQCGFLFDDNDE